MAYWLLKSEPDDWSWAEQVAKGRQGAEWTGIRNRAYTTLLQEVDPALVKWQSKTEVR